MKVTPVKVFGVSLLFMAVMFAASLPVKAFSLPFGSGPSFLWPIQALAAIILIHVLFRVKEGRTVPFVSRRSILTGRVCFAVLGVAVVFLTIFLAHEHGKSFGNKPADRLKNNFRFAGEYSGTVVKYSPFLSAKERETVQSALSAHKGPDAFVKAQLAPVSAKERKAGIVKVRNGEVVGAFQKASAWPIHFAATLLGALILLLSAAAVKLIALGHAFWRAFTYRKRSVMKLLNLLYYIGYIPMVVVFGFVWSPRDLPRTYGSPGLFARVQAGDRLPHDLVAVEGRGPHGQ